MSVRGFTAAVIALALLLSLRADPAEAQGRLSLGGSFSALGVYDDHVFFEALDPGGEIYTRYTPAATLSYLATPRLSLSGSYSFDAEVFPEHPSLNRAFARQRAGFGLQHRLSPLASWSFGAGYAESITPRDLVAEEVGIEFPRRNAKSYSAQVGFQRQITPTDSLRLGYAYRLIDVGEGLRPWGQYVSVGWSHQFSPRTSLTVNGGPRFGEGVINARASASLSYQLRRGSLSLGYTHSRTVVPVEPGHIDVDSARVSFARQLSPRFHVSASSGVFWYRWEDDDSRSYRLTVGAGHQMTRWLSLVTGWRTAYQERRFAVLDLEEDRRRYFNNQFYVGIAFGKWIPLD